MEETSQTLSLLDTVNEVIFLACFTGGGGGGAPTSCERRRRRRSAASANRKYEIFNQV